MSGRVAALLVRWRCRRGKHDFACGVDIANGTTTIAWSCRPCGWTEVKSLSSARPGRSVAVIPVRKVYGDLIAARYLRLSAAALDAAISALPPDGVILSGSEVAQIREVLSRMLIVVGALGIAHTDPKVVDLEAALALLDSADEER